MANFKENDSTSFLDEFRGKDFEGRWPTVIQMFEIVLHLLPPVGGCWSRHYTDRGHLASGNGIQIKHQPFLKQM